MVFKLFLVASHSEWKCWTLLDDCAAPVLCFSLLVSPCLRPQCGVINMAPYPAVYLKHELSLLSCVVNCFLKAPSLRYVTCLHAHTCKLHLQHLGTCCSGKSNKTLLCFLKEPEASFSYVCDDCAIMNENVPTHCLFFFSFVGLFYLNCVTTSDRE